MMSWWSVNIKFLYSSQQQAVAVSPNDESVPKESLSIPTPDNIDKPASPKLESIVTSISQLNLLEVSELAQLLKKRLNIPDAPVMPMGGIIQASPAEDEEEAPVQAIQTSFTLKLLKFEANQKVAIIKELKNLMEGMNLVQAKKVVESAPVSLKEDISKEEAEKFKEALEKVGATCEIS